MRKLKTSLVGYGTGKVRRVPPSGPLCVKKRLRFPFSHVHPNSLFHCPFTPKVVKAVAFFNLAFSC